jgi:ATP-binding protein involved in chromosome partitioning
MCNDYGADFLGALPLNISIRQQADAGFPTVVADPDGAISAIYKTIARQVAIKVASLSKDMSSKFPNIVVQST